MKTMTCRQLGGACDMKFQAETFEQIAEMSKKHGMEMFEKQDPVHLEAMKEMQMLMRSPQAMQDWFQNKRKEFNELPLD
ncbi:DUF1059 domain-containing protein [Spongiivirga sp. MCCC 1A20706]|uniref:DUF1059 domain-containing protein n=1 Tax=Spongiivirga sp. MCCC 1A20706 TaxID=3160963 RepID=UPI00397788F2